MPRKLPGPAILSTVALLIIAVWEIAVLARSKSRAPSEQDWREVTALVDQEWRTGDLVVFAPEWMDPVGRMWLGKHLTLDDAGRMDAAGYARIWEVSSRGAQAPELAGHAAELERQFGPLRVRRITQAPAPYTWRAHAGAQLTEVDFKPRRCMRMGGARIFKQVPLGGRLVIRAGLADVWARKENKAYARIVVTLDGAKIKEMSVGNDDGWVLVVDQAVTPGLHDVGLASSTDPDKGDPDHAKLELCVAAEGRTPPVELGARP